MLPNSEGRASDVEKRRHPLYFIEEGNTIVSVENTLYSIPRFLLKRSELFQTLFSLDPGPDGAVEGLTTDNPFDLGKADASLKQADFDAFAKALLLPTYSEYGGTKRELQSLAKLAHKWEFTELHTYALNQLYRRGLSPTERLEIAVKYHSDSPDRLREAYINVCLQLAPADMSVYNAMVPHLEVSKFLDLQRARRTVWRHLNGLMNRKEKTKWGMCLSTPNFCHSYPIFDTVLEKLIQLADVDQCDGEGPKDNKTFEDVFKDILCVQTEPCHYCRSHVHSRLHSFIRMDEIRSIVESIMMPAVPNESDDKQPSFTPEQETRQVA